MREERMMMMISYVHMGGKHEPKERERERDDDGDDDDDMGSDKIVTRKSRRCAMWPMYFPKIAPMLKSRDYARLVHEWLILIRAECADVLCFV